MYFHNRCICSYEPNHHVRASSTTYGKVGVEHELSYTRVSSIWNSPAGTGSAMSQNYEWLESCLVAPSDGTPREGLWLSSLALVENMLNVQREFEF
jgi:hypothetical protein